MVELTPQERKELENMVMDRLCSGLADDSVSRLIKQINQIAVEAAIATIQEYAKMKG